MLENIDVAKRGGKIASNAKKKLEAELGETVVTKNNNLYYKYMDNKVLETK